MAALDGEQEIAEGGGIGADDMEIGAERVAHHALGIADAAGAVEREAGGQAVQDGAARAGPCAGWSPPAPGRCRFRDTPLTSGTLAR